LILPELLVGAFLFTPAAPVCAVFVTAGGVVLVVLVAEFALVGGAVVADLGSEPVFQPAHAAPRVLLVFLVQGGAEKTIAGIEQLVQAGGQLRVVGDQVDHFFGEVSAPGGYLGAFLRKVVVAGGM
jgi:hypothetical protein